MDDFILIGITRAEALSHRAAIVEFLVDRLGLELSKSTIAPVRRGANFVGYRTWASRRFVRRHALYTYRRALAAERIPNLLWRHPSATLAARPRSTTCSTRQRQIMTSIVSYRKTSDAHTIYDLRTPDAQGDEVKSSAPNSAPWMASPTCQCPPVSPCPISCRRFAYTLQPVELTTELRERLKAISPHCALIAERMVQKIRARYSIDDEMFRADRRGCGDRHVSACR